MQETVDAIAVVKVFGLMDLFKNIGNTYSNIEICCAPFTVNQLSLATA